MPIRVYNYGAKPPAENAAAVAEQIYLAHRYRNTLTEIERKRRADRDAARIECFPELAEAERAATAADEEVVRLTAEAKRANACGRTRKIEPAAAKAIRDAKAAQRASRDYARHLRAEAFGPDALKAARSALSAAKKSDAAPNEIARLSLAVDRAESEWYDRVPVARECSRRLASIQEVAISAGKAARAECGVYWGTYLLIETAQEAANKSAAPPRFSRFDGCGRIGVQIQGGMTTDALMAGTDQRLRIVAEGEARGDGARRAVAWLRIGSNPDRSPIWTTARIILHRPLPPGRIKVATLNRLRIGGKDDWSLHVTIDADADAIAKRRGRAGITDATCAVNLGWRVVKGGIRVATWAGTDGREGSVVISDAELSRWSKSESIQSIRDRNYTDALGAFREWLGGAKDLPEWMREKTTHVHLWKGQSLLAGLVLHWRDHRFSGDESVFAAASAWRKQDKHLWLWQSNGLRKAIAWRKHLYRNCAAMLTRGSSESAGYGRVILGDVDWVRTMAKLPAEAGKSENETARYHARVASPGAFALILRQAGAEEVPCADATQTCHACGSVENFDAAPSLHHACGVCGAVWDQDANHCRNLLAAHASGTVVA